MLCKAKKGAGWTDVALNFQEPIMNDYMVQFVQVSLSYMSLCSHNKLAGTRNNST